MNPYTTTTPSPFDKALIKPETLAEYVSKYMQTLSDLAEFEPAYEKVQHVLMSGSGRSSASVDIAKTRDALRKGAWREIINKFNLFSVMSMKRVDEINHGFYDESTTCDKIGIPEFTIDNILSFIDTQRESLPDLMAEKVCEVYDILRPHNRWRQLKTNDKSLAEGIGEKVILSGYFEQKWGGGLKVNYRRKDQLNAIQAVFWLLDGKGTPKDGEKMSYVLDAAKRAEAYEDEYLRIKGYQNGNAHFEFKRMDLVKKMMVIVKDRVLKQPA